VWAEKVKTSLDLRNAISAGDGDKIAELSRKERFDLKTTQDVKVFMELDVRIQDMLEKMPALPPEEKEKLSEQEGERMDKVMEAIRRAALEMPLRRVADQSVVMPLAGKKAIELIEEDEGGEGGNGDGSA
jgi:hypothetical protein